MKDYPIDKIHLLYQKNQQAQRLLYDTYIGVFKSFLRGKLYKGFLTATNEDIEEICNDAFITIFDKITTYAATGSLYSWMIEVLYRKYLQWVRDNKKVMQDGVYVNKPMRIISRDHIDEELPTNSGIEAIIDYHILQQYIDRLSITEQQAITLYLQGYTNIQAAEKLGRHRAPVGKQTLKVKQKLIKQLT